MNEHLWAGADLKVEYARFFLQEMSRSLQPPERTRSIAAQESSGNLWQRSFYPNLDAFLAMARSVAEIIQCCFGEDRSLPMKEWFNVLSCSERANRKAFSRQFRADRDEFSRRSLSTARNISFHRTGFPSVEVAITGRFGVVHTGSPVKRVPNAESRNNTGDHPDALLWAATQAPNAVRPVWSDFTIDGKPLYDECQDYLALAEQLVVQARAIAQRIHGTDSLTAPSEIK
jgi:hypothetical protein